jgi:hypothetical protein
MNKTVGILDERRESAGNFRLAKENVCLLVFCMLGWFRFGPVAFGVDLLLYSLVSYAGEV